VTALESALAERPDMVRDCSGIILFQSFGEEPFSPEPKEAAIRADGATAGLWQEYQGRMARAVNAVAPREEQSFTIVAFPSPRIRGDFERIFEETLEINMLENERYERIQHEVIAVLDRAARVRITGREGNRTDLVVALPPLADPATQTNFVNCVADVNIPLGEVFTSPRLEGTHGVLHVKEAFLKGLRFRDLELRFEDGFVVGYTCGNFDDEEQNRAYVRENLLFPHETLPMGEFAIGTNTLAYAMARRHGILDLLPVLIVEKMGPHVAVGDTCFRFQEDHAIRNPLDGKEMVARENEHSRRRHEDPQAAYMNCHIDITLPYRSLDAITAVLPSGEEIDVLRGGRFVLPGTESLNAPIDEVDG
jgi:leucyl aminopeptidase (aminopeptidase T)